MSIIRDKEKTKHVITDFVFGDLDETRGGGDSNFTPLFQQESKSDEVVSPEPQIVEQPYIPKIEKREELERRDKMIETLIEKSDVLSKELIKVQAKLTNQESLFRDEMKKAKEDAFNRGVQEGLTQSKMGHDIEYREKTLQLQESISKLENLSSKFSSMMKTVEKELIHASIEIAKEVIESEITYNSGQVAINLAKSLIKKIEEAKEIKIRVNSVDYEEVKNGLSNLQHVEVVSDSAVTRGGVIISSDVGSIEGNIMKRYKKVKDDIFSNI